jgi:hypothetical protein
MLAESFAREATLPTIWDGPGSPLRERLEASPLLVAYVVRWLELRDGVPRDSWRSIVG